MGSPLALLLALVLLIGSASEGFGQVVDGPPGSVGGLLGGRRPVDPNRTSQSLAMNIDLSGGYERDPGQLVDTTDPALSIEGWYATTASASSRYRIGHVRRSIEVDGRGFLNYQDNIGASLIGGHLSVDGSTYFSRRGSNQLSVALETSYEPGAAFGAISAELNPEGELTAPFPLAPLQGITEQRWLVMSSTARYRQHWNTDHQSNVQFYVGRVRPISDADGLESEWQNAIVTHNWALTRQVGLMGVYRHNRSQGRDSSVVYPSVQFMSFEGGAQMSRRLSRNRMFTASITAGATRVLDSVAVLGVPASLHPSFRAEAALTTVRSLGVSVGVHRDVAVLQGVSPSPMVNDSAAVTLSGTFARRVRMALTGNFQRSTSLTGDATRFDTSNAIGGSAELRYGFARWGGVFAGVSRYRHRLQEELVVAGLPSRYDRFAARVGLTLWVPLYGAF